MGSSCAIGRRNAAWTDCPGVKAFSYHARFGWPLAGTYSTERRKHASCSSACSMCEMTWDSFPRNTIRARNDSWEIFHRRFRMLRFLLPREFLMVNRRYRNDKEQRSFETPVATALWAVFL